MNKSELISRLCRKHSNLDYNKIELTVNSILEHVSSSLENGTRVEIRGFGSYNLVTRPSRNSRNPKTGIKLVTNEKKVARFRPAKELRERVNNQRDNCKTV